MNYAAKQFTWTDTDIISFVSTLPDPCGVITHELQDVSSGSATSLDTAVFSAIDLASTTKTFSVATSDLTKTGSYTLRLTVYYTLYSAS